MKYKYLASPYTGSPSVMVERFHAAKAAMAALLGARIWIYSPIVHCHQLAQDHSLPTDFEFWIEYNHVMMENSGGLFILGIEGWDRSKGVAEERQFARTIGLSENLIRPDDYAILPIANTE